MAPELAGWLHSQSCSQRPNVQVETSDEWRSPGVSTVTGAAEHLCWQHGQRDQVHPQQVCRWHQAVWCSQHDWWKGYHPEGPWQAWDVGPWEPHEVQHGLVQGPAHGSGQAQIQAGWRTDLEQPSEGLGGAAWQEAQHDPVICAHSPEGQPYPGLHPQQHGHQGEGGDSAPLLRSGETLPRSPASKLWSPQHRRAMDLLEGARGGHSNDPRAGTPLLWWKAERVGAVQPGQEKAPGRPYCGLSVPEETYKKAGKGLFTRTWSDGTRSNGFKLKEGRFRLDIRNKFYEGGEALAQVAQRSCGCSLIGSVQDQVGWGFEQAGLVEGVPAHGRGVGPGWSLRTLPIQTILWFYVSCNLLLNSRKTSTWNHGSKPDFSLTVY